MLRKAQKRMDRNTPDSGNASAVRFAEQWLEDRQVEKKNLRQSRDGSHHEDKRWKKRSSHGGKGAKQKRKGRRERERAQFRLGTDGLFWPLQTDENSEERENTELKKFNDFLQAKSTSAQDDRGDPSDHDGSLAEEGFEDSYYG